MTALAVLRSAPGSFGPCSPPESHAVDDQTRNFVYKKAVDKHLLHGDSVSDDQIQAWADEAEAGYDLSKLPAPRRGRPPLGNGPTSVLTVRLDAETIAAPTARAEADGITTRSEAIRTAVREWAHVA